MSKKTLGPTILVTIGLLFIAAVGFRTISTPEIWSHLAQGKANVPLSIHQAADSAVNTTWLYDKLAYAIWSAGGANLLVLLNIVLLVGTFILLLQVSKKWGGALSQGFALLIAGHLIFQGLDVGPDTVMLLFLALFMLLLTSAKSPTILFGALIPLQILWTNLHGSFIYGPLLAILAIIQATQQNKGSARNRKQQGLPGSSYAILTVALLAATAVNPYLFKMHAQALANIKAPYPAYGSSLFTEFFQMPALKPLILFVMILGAGGLITLKKKLPFLLTTVAIYGAFLAMTSAQMAMLFAVLSFPFIVLSLNSLSEYVGGSLQHVLGDNAKHLAPATTIVFILLIVLSVVPLANNCAYARTGSASNFGLGVEDGLYPNGVESIINDPAFPAPEKTINLPADGGYLAFNYGRKVFIDYRPGRYDKELLETLSGLMSGNRQAYSEILLELRPEALIINTLPPSAAQGISTLLSLAQAGEDQKVNSVWKLAYFDGTTAILILNKPQFASIFNNIEAQQAGLAKLESARAEYARKVGSCKAGNPPELIGASKVYLALNRLHESKSLFSLLLQGNDRIPAAWIGLGESQLRLKEFDAAVASLETATQIAPRSLDAWQAYSRACAIYAARTKDNVKRSELKAKASRAADEVKQLVEKRRKQTKEEQPEEPAPAEQPQSKSLEDMAAPAQ